MSFFLWKNICLLSMCWICCTTCNSPHYHPQYTNIENISLAQGSHLIYHALIHIMVPSLGPCSLRYISSVHCILEKNYSFGKRWGLTVFLFCQLLLEEWLCDSVITKVILDVGHEEPSVPVICDVASVVDTSDEVLQSIPWGLLILVQVDTQQILRNLWDDRKGLVQIEM